MPIPPSLADKMLADAEIAARCGLNVIAIREDGQIVTHLTWRPVAGSTLVARAARSSGSVSATSTPSPWGRGLFLNNGTPRGMRIYRTVRASGTGRVPE